MIGNIDAIAGKARVADENARPGDAHAAAEVGRVIPGPNAIVERNDRAGDPECAATGARSARGIVLERARAKNRLHVVHGQATAQEIIGCDPVGERNEFENNLVQFIQTRGRHSEDVGGSPAGKNDRGSGSGANSKSFRRRQVVNREAARGRLVGSGGELNDSPVRHRRDGRREIWLVVRNVDDLLRGTDRRRERQKCASQKKAGIATERIGKHDYE